MARSSTKSEATLDPTHIFTSEELFRKLETAKGHSLGEVDINHVFDAPSKNKGIAGHVIEESVLGYKKDSRPEHDIEVDGIGTEVKTTGVKKVDGKYIAKEPVSITGVFIDTIVLEEFERSHFWDKVRQMLFVYYFYDYNGPFDVQVYRRFMILGYELRVVSDADKVILESDWTKVRDYLREAKKQPEPERYYPEISHMRLMYLDVAPKYPNPPRFRFRQPYVNGFIQEFFYGRKQAQLPFKFDKYEEFDGRCAQLTKECRGMTVRQLLDRFQIETKTIHKAISERIILAMFDSEAQKINDIDVFNKLGLIGKSLVQSLSNGRTEDMKLFKINFDEIRDKSLKFEDSEFYSYFRDYQILTILFQEQTKKDVRFEDNRFLGFKRVSFSDDFIEYNVKPVWLEIRKLVNEGELREVCERKSDGS